MLSGTNSFSETPPVTMGVPSVSLVSSSDRINSPSTSCAPAFSSKHSNKCSLIVVSSRYYMIYVVGESIESVWGFEVFTCNSGVTLCWKRCPGKASSQVQWPRSFRLLRWNTADWKYDLNSNLEWMKQTSIVQSRIKVFMFMLEYSAFMSAQIWFKDKLCANLK